MLKKFFTLLFVLLWCTVLMAQINEVDPNGETGANVVDTPGDVLYGWDIDALTGENGNLGVEYAAGYLWITCRGLNSPLGNKVVKIDVSDPLNPVVVDSMSQGTTSAWGWRDMCYDGTYLYASDSDSMVQFDPVTMTVTGSFPGVNNPNRALAYDPATDHFWTASFTSDMWEFDRTGAIINQFPSATSMYGAGWDSYIADGPWLWANGGTGVNVIQIDPTTGLATGVSYWVAGGSDGGLDIDVDLVPGKMVAISLVQTAPDSVYVIELGDYSAPGGAFPEVLYYSFNEAGSDSTKNDAIPGRGDAWAQVMGALTLGGAGQCGSALVGAGNPGSADYVNTGWVTDIGTSDWTISLWLNNLEVGSTSLRYLFGDNTAGSYRSFLNGIAGMGWIALRGGGLADVFVGPVAPGPSVVHFVYDSSVPEVRAYINGVLSVTVAQSALNITGTAPFKVGGYSSSAGMFPGSLMDEFRYYSRALDATEIANTWSLCPVPVELTSFTASVNENNINLNWETASEINNSGFQVERKSIGEYEAIGFVPGFGTTTEPKAYSFTDLNLNPGTYSYRLKQIDYDGTFEYSDPVEVDITVPDVYSLYQNYPNPFNPSTTITFTLAANANVTLRVFDVLGQEVMTLVNQDLTAGVHTYDFDAASFNSGVYFYRIEANGNDGTNFTNVKKMILLK